jgi:DNA primase
MGIPARFMNELRDRLTLSDIVGRRMKLARAGREFKGCCPFHNEKTPSFTVNDDKQFYHCFGCGAHGDVIGFVMEHDNLSFIDAVELLAADAGMQVPKQTPQEIKKAKEEKNLYSLLEETALFFEKNLFEPKNKEALGYMKERGMESLLRPFRIGFAPENPQALRSFLSEKGYTDAQMIEAGVLKVSDKGKEPYAFFRDRIMFPVLDRKGRVVAFGGRVLPDYLRAPARGSFTPPKYINSSDSELFHKGRMLYSEGHARQAVTEGDPLIVVEGYTDVMALFKAGFKGAVAPLGTALTEDQILILWQILTARDQMPVLCFDGDSAGRRAAFRAAERMLPLLKPDQSALFAFLPSGQDPDSLIKAHGKKSFESVLGAAMPLVQFLWVSMTEGKTFDTPEAKAGLAKKLEEKAERITDRSVQNYYRQMFKDMLYKHFGNRSYNKFKKGYPANVNQQLGVKLRRPAFSANRLPQMILLACIINHPEIYEEVEEGYAQLYFQDNRLDNLRKRTMNYITSEENLDTQALQRHLTSAGFKNELELILSDAIYTHAGFAKPSACIEDVKEGWKEVSEMIQRRTVDKELVAAAHALAEDFSKENEEKFLALQSVHRIEDS